MTCGYCQHSNFEEDHRCRKCGRRLLGTVVAAPASIASEHVRVVVKALGANALAATSQSFIATSSGAAAAPALAREPELAQARSQKRAVDIPMDLAATVDELPRPRARQLKNQQPSLFGAEFQPKIIPFETLPRTEANTAAIASTPAAEPVPIREQEKPRKAVRRAPDAKPVLPQDSQSTLDFLEPAKPAPRTLKTNAEAVIYCDAPVASPIHRATAAALDWSMIAVAYGIVLITFETVGHPATLNRTALLLLGGMFAISAVFYNLLFTIAGANTPGMRWTHLRLINFDGFPPEGGSRALRLIGSWISLLSGGVGLLWAFLDEENLTWHDHISKTFPTLLESNSIVVRPHR